MASRATGSATISFGLVSIPVKLYTATSTAGLSFHMLHKTCGTRVKMQLYCPFDKAVISRRDTVKGYEHAKDQFVRFEEDELRKLEAEKTDQLDIVEFVPSDSVDDVYIADTRYLGPGKGGDRAYKLLGESMERTGRVAVGRFWTHGKTQLVVLRPYKGGLLMQQVHYADEVRSMDDVERPGKVTFKPIEEQLADKLIEQLSVDTFRPEQYKDEYRERVLSAVEQKVAGREVIALPEQPQAQIIDLFEALKRSLADKKAAAAVTSGAGPTTSDAGAHEAEPEAGGEPDEAHPKLTKAPARRGAPRVKKQA